MCFSATASFSSAALLFSVGTATTLVNKSATHKMFAMTPLLFGIQQFCEGIIWITIRQNDSGVLAQHVALILFLFIAMAVWPTWIPWSVINLESSFKRKRYLQILLAIGLFTSVLATLALVIGPTHIRIVGHSLDYSMKNPFKFLTPNFGSFIYTASTIGPFFVSSVPIVKRMGFLIVAALLTTMIINEHAVTSVWCFFSALVSFYIAGIVLFNEQKLMA